MDRDCRGKQGSQDPRVGTPSSLPVPRCVWVVRVSVGTLLSCPMAAVPTKQVAGNSRNSAFRGSGGPSLEVRCREDWSLQQAVRGSLVLVSPWFWGLQEPQGLQTPHCRLRLSPMASPQCVCPLPCKDTCHSRWGPSVIPDGLIPRPCPTLHLLRPLFLKC